MDSSATNQSGGGLVDQNVARVGQIREIVGCSCNDSTCLFKKNVGKRFEVTKVTNRVVYIRALEDFNSTVGWSTYVIDTMGCFSKEDIEEASRVVNQPLMRASPYITTPNNLCPACGVEGQWVNMAMKCPICWKTW